jgi:hypothetical protein
MQEKDNNNLEAIEDPSICKLLVNLTRAFFLCHSGFAALREKVS